jgi:thiol-disulfide isomerase/thioredoxin
MKFWFLLLFTVASFCSYCQKTDKTFADTAFVYKGFDLGGTTINLWFYSKAVDTIKNITKIQLNGQSTDTLNFLIRHIKPKRHFQQKVGRSFYASIIKDGQERRIAIVPNWAIIDLENKIQYVFKDTPYAEIYSRFVDKNYR